MKYNVDKVISTLVKDLNPRQRDVVFGRYGLEDGEPVTLAEIGNRYGVTRERIRQIEALALSSVRRKFSDGQFNDIVDHVRTHLRQLGGVHLATSLCNDLKGVLSTVPVDKAYNSKIHFILESSGAFNYQGDAKAFHPFWFLTRDDYKRAERFIDRLSDHLKNKKDDLILKNSYQAHFATVVSTEDFDSKIANNFIAVSKKFATNAYSDFGPSSWSEICPKTSRDWAYLVLKKSQKPLHFTLLTSEINKFRKGKVTNPQTVHNELIKDERFVLVGRGIYGLREFNLMSGTAKEVIAEILKKHGPQNSREIIKLVLDQRIFKENTLLLNLQDKKSFLRNDDGRYNIRKA